MGAYLCNRNDLFLFKVKKTLNWYLLDDELLVFNN